MWFFFFSSRRRHTRYWRDWSSDVCSSDLQSRAKQDNGGWILNGQKVWTTNAQFSAYGLLLARTDPEQHKHKGLTMFIVPMDAEGVTVRGLRQITGEIGRASCRERV